MSGGDPKDCLYHVWAWVQPKPGNLSHTLAEVCLACGMHRPTVARAHAQPIRPVSVTAIDGYGYEWSTPPKKCG